jgi:hypothetical protein
MTRNAATPDRLALALALQLSLKRSKKNTATSVHMAYSSHMCPR